MNYKIKGKDSNLEYWDNMRLQSGKVRNFW